MIKVSIEPRQLVAGRDSKLAVRFFNAGPRACSDIVFKLDLPAEFLLLRGRSRMEIPELGPGESCAQEVIVRARSAGDFVVSSPNFSYRDQFDHPVPSPSFGAELSVLPPSTNELETAGISAEYAGRALTVGEWDVLPVRIRNSSDSPIKNLVLAISGPMAVGPAGHHVRLPSLGPREETEATFVVLPKARGRRVPVHFRTAYLDTLGRARTQNYVLPVGVTDSEPGAARTGSGGGPTRPDTILYLAANPAGLPPLRSDKEMREIKEQLDAGKFRDRFNLESCSAVRLRDIGRALADYDPKIVHFSGHGERDGSIYVEDEQGYQAPVMAEGLADLFRLHAPTLDCVIVNACHSAVLGRSVKQYINNVIAMRFEIGDTAAITFSIGFYQGLAGGFPVAEAFKRGRAFLRAQPMGEDEHDTPVLM